MLEGLIAWVLRTYIGEYVENLNTDQLSVGIYQGQVELENLPLRKDALNSLDLPLEVKSGFIGKVQLSIPWNKLNSAPWVITLEKLYLVTGPVKNRKYNEEEEKKAQEKRKQDQLKALEEKWKVQRNLAPQGGASWWSYTASSFASMATNIVENLQLNVRNVHIRYEDDITIPNSSFACGVTIESLSAQSTDASWVPKFVSRTKADLMYKLVDLKQFAVYWDTEASMVGSLTGLDLEMKLKHIGSTCNTMSTHQYILEPVCAQAKMTRNTSVLPLRNSATPRLSMDLQLDKIPLELAEDQYRGMVAWARQFSRFDTARRYRQWEPDCSVRENPAAWWHFCTQATLHFIKDRNRRLSRDFLLRRARDNVKYVAAYEDFLEKAAYMDPVLKFHMEKCEGEMTFEEIKILRELVMMRVAERDAAAMKAKGDAAAAEEPLVAPLVPDSQPAQSQGTFKSWFPGWGGWYRGQPTEEKTIPQPQRTNVDFSKLSVEEREKIDREIEQEILSVVADSAENNTLLKRDTVFARINFCLQSGSFKLLSPSSKGTEGKLEGRGSILELECTAIRLECESRPRTNGMRFAVSMGGLFLRDKMTKDSIMPLLVSPQIKDKTQSRQPLMGLLGMGRGSMTLPNLFSSPQGASSTEKDSLFEFVFEKKPQHSKSDYRVEIKSKPLEIVYNPAVIKRLKTYFSTSGSRLDPNKPSLASVRYEEIKRNTQAEFQQALGRFLEGDKQISAKRWDIVVDIAAPQLIVPESLTDSNCQLLVVDLGHLTFNNLPAGLDTGQRARADTNDDDDDFVTPDSTPPNEPEDSVTSGPQGLVDSELTPSASLQQMTSSAGEQEQQQRLREQQRLSELVREMSEQDVRDRIYDKYHLSLSDLHVMIGTGRDNWKHAQSKGTSKMHVVDKFSISLQLERRLLYTSDPLWPKALLAGTLPTLVVHVSEQKVQALKTCINILSSYTPSEERRDEPVIPSPAARKIAGPDLNQSVYNALIGKPSKTDPEETPSKAFEKDKFADSRLLVMQFSINQMSLEIQSRGRSIAELQVSAVSATLTSRAYDTSLSFTVHSLLVVDALQTFGSDFELLVASHKNLWIDSCSGSIRDSGANSPVSPPYSPDYHRSPVSPGSPAEPAGKPLLTPKTSLTALQSALTSKVQALGSPIDSTTSLGLPLSPDSSFSVPSAASTAARPSQLPLEPTSAASCKPFLLGHDSEALIRLDLDFLSPEAHSRPNQTDGLLIATLQFNNLDFVANQQTITELLSFVKRVSPDIGSNKKEGMKEKTAKSATEDQVDNVSDNGGGIQLEVTAEFHRLNVLLMRVDEHFLGQPTASKVATATMLDARIEAHLVGDLQLSGFLSGLQLLDLTPAGKRHQKIISVGQDPNMSAIQASLLNVSKCTEMYKTALGESVMFDPTLDRAFTFEFRKPGSYGATPLCTPTRDVSPDNSLYCYPNETCLVLKMASLFYTHSPVFLKELSLCISEFKDYVEQVGDSIKTAATEVAMGLVQTKSDMNTSLHMAQDLKPNFRKQLSTVDEADEPSEQETTRMDSSVSSPSVGIRLDAQLQTPVIILPRAPDSTQVLIGHLGKITVQNFNMDQSLDKSQLQRSQESDIVSRDKIFFNIRDISVYSIDLNQKLSSFTMTQSFNASCADASMFGNNRASCLGTPIVHDTGVSFTVQKIELDSIVEPPKETCDETFTMDDIQSASQIEQPRSKGTKVHVDGGVVTPLKVVLSKQVFEQLKDTLDNIAPPDDDEMPGSPPILRRAADETPENLFHTDSVNLNSMTNSASSFRERTTSDANTLNASLNKDPSLVITASFTLPTLAVNMTGEVGDGEQGLVDLKLKGFKVVFEKADQYTKEVEISLQSLVMVDLLQDADSRHRHLMVSYSSDCVSGISTGYRYLSSSCPSSMVDLPQLDMPPSLPNSLHRDNVWDAVYDARGRGRSRTHVQMHERGSHSATRMSSDYPSTPPPSPLRSRSVSRVSVEDETPATTSASSAPQGRLVYIKAKLIDKKCPELKSKYNNTQRFIDVDFNRLETTLNLQTWVVLLDFLGLGAKAHDPEQFKADSQRQRRRSGRNWQPSGPPPTEKEEPNNEVTLKIQSFSLVLNKPEYELALASVSGFSAQVSMRDGNLAIRGQLGSCSLQDSSPYGQLFKERFITTGKQALDFDIFKYGLPDPDNVRDCDVSFKLRMNSVWYVHTQRFIMEILAFALNFNQLQDVLGRMRAASAGKKVQTTAFRSARVKLDIEAGAPVILIPHSSKTTDVLVIDMGRLSVHNTFKYDHEPGTVSYNEKKSREERQNEETRQRSDTADTLVPDSPTTESGPQVMTTDTPFFPPPPAQHSNIPSLDLMSSSVYGSLDIDTREELLETTNISSLTEEDFHLERSRGLQSFSSSVGGSGMPTSPLLMASAPGQFILPSVASDGARSKQRFNSGNIETFPVHLLDEKLKRRSKSGDTSVPTAAPPSPRLATNPPPYIRADTEGSDPENHVCFLDVIHINLNDIDLFSAVWEPNVGPQARAGIEPEVTQEGQLVFPSYVIRRESGKLLDEKGRLAVQVERNLEGEISHAVPDILIDAWLSAVHGRINVQQYALVKGLLFHNIGEDLEQFETKLINFEDPQIQTVLSGQAWTGKRLILHLENVTLDLVNSHGSAHAPEQSLARIDFLASRLTFDSYSDGSKDIDLVSHEIRLHDTRYTSAPANVKPNVFDRILQPSSETAYPHALQLELHYRATKTHERFTVLLNNMRLMGVFDWLLAVKDYIATPVPDPWKQKDVVSTPPTPMPRSPSKPNPLIVSNTGVLTKRVSREDTHEPPFEFCLNLTDSEFVVVENTADRDTNAVILKMTAILTYKPDSLDKPLQCNLQSLEVFSCSLSDEDETALSIIDPMSLNVELNKSLMASKTAIPPGLLDARPLDSPPVLDISFQALNIRVSYNDVKLFLAIMNSMPKQLTLAQEQSRPRNLPPYDPVKFKRLLDLGFARDDCERALDVCKGNVQESGLWLMQNAKLKRHDEKSGAGANDADEDGSFISGVELRGMAVSLCVIDDCLDADVPLVEFTVPTIHLSHRLSKQNTGKLDMRLQADYYNRSLSGWEPLIERWRCVLNWERQNAVDGSRTGVSLTSEDVLSVNVTQALLQLWRDTQRKWTEEYYSDRHGSATTAAASKRRVPFVPFAIRNETGCDIRFAVTVTTPNRYDAGGHFEPGRAVRDQSEWRCVRPGEERPFLVEEREKSRHKSTHELKVRQVIVAVAGWQQMAPVSLDKIGVYFREAIPCTDYQSAVYQELPPARVVFDVAMEGTARKVITVRSALLIHNQLNEPLEIKLEQNPALSGASCVSRGHIMHVDKQCRTPVPLPHVHSQILCRPSGWSLDWCPKPIHWRHVRKPGETNNSLRACDTMCGEKDTYKFCVSVYRQHFPLELSVTGTSHHSIVYEQPGHVITVVPPLSVENLLPIEMHYYLKDTDIRGTVKAGKVKSIVSADLTQAFELGVNLDCFPTCRELTIPPDTLDYRVKLAVFDTQNRLLELWVHILAGLGGSLKLTISAPYWLANKSGLPLVFRQDSTTEVAAGQFDEHEVARSRVPLLFSYAEKEAREKCTMRIGKKWKGDMHRPRWCDRFSLERDCGVRPVHVLPADGRPDWVYNIGIEVRQGRGRYSDTNIVTFSPRYQLDNRSSHKLLFAQRHQAQRADRSMYGDHMTAVPNCTVPFHWPRVDLDQLLCVRMLDVEDSDWSGGFRIDQVNSFHINMRQQNSESLFLMVDIVLQGATFFVVLTDADNMPPPYRIDNFSDVALQYFQTKCADERLRSQVRPRTSLAYAWDEPTLPPHVTLTVSGGSSATYNMDVVADGEQLFYENFIYIACKATFPTRKSPGVEGEEVAAVAAVVPWQHSLASSQELVLEVQHYNNNKIVLRKKEPGNRNQLWRMTSKGLLQHEGSSAPRDARYAHRSGALEDSYYAAGPSTVYVLDVEDIALRPAQTTKLMLRRPDERRSTTQRWQFTEDGRLCCASSRQLSVQVLPSHGGLTAGSEVFLGPSPPITKASEVAPGMQIVRQRLRPGSGFLSVKVITDGPTRVLQITDIRQQQYAEDGDSDWIVVEERRRRPELDNRPAQQPGARHELAVVVSLPRGLGVSLVSSAQEELAYVELSGIDVSYTAAHGTQTTDLNVKNIMVNNQILGTMRPAALYVTPQKRVPELDELPALAINCQKMPNDKWDAHIFRHLFVVMKPLTVQVEELLLLKLLQFAGLAQSEADLNSLDDEDSFDSQRALKAATSMQRKRFYFSTLKIMNISLSLSMYTASELPRDFKRLKKNTVFKTLVRFEDAKCELDPFIRVHMFETSTLLAESLRIHYTQEVKSQAAQILGAVDFLGNPLGLYNDVSEGLSGLLRDGNVGGLVKNLTHGTFNSASKVTGTISDTLGLIIADEDHQRTRKKIREKGESGSHIKAALKGLGHGVWGGVASIPWQTYTGIKNDGVEGLFTGFFKGTIGTVAKPIAGMLDFVSSSAGAVSHTSKGSARKQPPRSRLPRCCVGPAGLLQPYSKRAAQWQAFLFNINDNNYREMFMALEDLRGNLSALMSSEKMYLVGQEDGRSKVMQAYRYDEMYSCCCIPDGGKYYVEITMKHEQEYGSTPSDFKTRPWVLCDSEACAQRVVQQTLYAKSLFEERRYTLLHDTP